jgi:hypothetical protein
MTNCDQKQKEHLDSKTSAFAASMQQEKQIFAETTNQTIKSYEAMNDRLRFENKAINTCCNSQSCSYQVQRSANPHKYPGVFMSTSQKECRDLESANKKSAIARDSICGAALCPS